MTNRQDLTISQKTINDGSLASVQSSIPRISQKNYQYLKIGPGYKLIRKIGSGNFGELWYGKNSTNGDSVGIKLEPVRTRSPQLHLEYKYYKILGSKSFLPLIYFFGNSGKYNVLAMELLGPNLEELFNKCCRRFSVKTVLLISKQVVKIFEFIHDCGLIYRDVKPDNFVVGIKPNCEKRIYLIDFGLAKEYVNPYTKAHIPYCENKSLTGTARYMSINTHLGREQSRRDDMESIGHMLIYFLRGVLPWQGLRVNEASERYKKIGETKQKTTIESLCKDLPDIWASYLRYCRNMDFLQRPDYTYLYNLFADFYTLLNYPDDDYDWTSLINTKQYNSIISSMNTFEHGPSHLSSQFNQKIRNSQEIPSNAKFASTSTVISESQKPSINQSSPQMKAYNQYIRSSPFQSTEQLTSDKSSSTCCHIKFNKWWFSFLCCIPLIKFKRRKFNTSKLKNICLTKSDLNVEGIEHL